MKECLEEGMIQAYVDGELSPPEAERVANHAGACAACAEAVAEAESELVLLSAAFEPELNLPVPSERLRGRLDAAIGELRAQSIVPEQASSRKLKAWFSALVPSFNFAPRHAFGFASLAAVVAFAAIFAIVALRRNENQPQLATVGDGPRETVAQVPVAAAPTVPEATQLSVVESTPVKVAGSRPVLVKPRRAGLPVNRASLSSKSAQPNVESVAKAAAPPVAESKPLPGEVSYLKAIASLASIIETNGENAIKPSLRADYERNLALVNQAISATQRQARRNPKDPNAAEFLYSTYQSKIDLLSTVAEQGQMVAIAR